MVEDSGKAVPQIMDRAYQTFNIPGMLETTNALSTRIDDIKGNLTGHGADGSASASQVDAAVNSNYLPRYLSSNEQLQRGVSLAQNQISTELIPWTTKINLANDQVARESVGYNTQQQRELDALLGRMQAGLQLTIEQQRRVDQLAESERNYALELARLSESKRQFDESQKIEGPEHLLEVGGGLYNWKTGEWIMPPKTSGGSSSGSGNITFGGGWRIK